jgi:hypothetical protein
MSTTSMQRAYTVAIALNNLGVSLLERDSYPEAKEAFQDAISVMMEISAKCEEQKMSTKRSLSSSTLDAKIRKASYNLSNCAAVKDDSKIKFCVFTKEESAAVTGAALQDENMFYDSSTTFLIRIEKTIHDCENSGVDLESSIILHNYGNVYKCLATTANTSACAKELCQGAFRLFQLSYSLLGRDEEGSPPISILILRSLACFASTLGMDREAKAYYSHMLNLKDSFLEMYDLFSEWNQIEAAAAA